MHTNLIQQIFSYQMYNKYTNLQFFYYTMDMQPKQSPSQKYQRIINYHIQQQEGDAHKVEVVCLKNNELPFIGNLGLFPNLTIVDLRNNRLTELVGLEQCTNLRQLYLCQNLITKIKRIKHLDSLRMIDLRANHIVDINRSIVNLPDSLTQLRLRCNKLTNLVNLSMIKCPMEIIWLDENQFIKTSRQYYSKMFRSKNWRIKDFWI